MSLSLSPAIECESTNASPLYHHRPPSPSKQTQEGHQHFALFSYGMAVEQKALNESLIYQVHGKLLHRHNCYANLLEMH